MGIINNRYLKFIINVVILLLFIGVSDQVIGRILKHYYFKQESGIYYRTTYAIDSTKADILVFGSSRANHHYVPEIFEDSLKLSFYNSGREGNFLLFNYGIFKAVVKRYNPKIIIFDINYNEMYYEKNEYERLSSLLPYFKDHPEIRNIIEMKSPFEKYKLISRIYPYNSCLVTIAIGNSTLNKTRKPDRKGYVPLSGYIKDTVIYRIDPLEGQFDSNKVNAVTDIIQYCNSKNIRLIFIQSPMYAIIKNTNSTDYFDKLAKGKKIVYWNLINYPDFLSHPRYFQDQDHLNDEGARYFSKKLVQKIEDLQAAPN